MVGEALFTNGDVLTVGRSSDCILRFSRLQTTNMSSGEDDFVQKVSSAKKICATLQSEDRCVRKQAFVDLQKLLSAQLSQKELQTIFNEIHIYTFACFRDKVEAVRSQAIKFMSFFILDCLAVNDYYLTYLFPVVVERIGTVELVEESEEIRLQLLNFMHATVNKYFGTEQLKPFLNDIVLVLCETVKDQHPEIKEASCKCIRSVAQALPRDFHKQAQSLVKPVLTAFGYQRYKIRVEAVKSMGKFDL